LKIVFQPGNRKVQREMAAKN